VRIDERRTQKVVVARIGARYLSDRPGMSFEAPAVFFVAGSGVRRSRVVTTQANDARYGAEEEGWDDGKWSGQMV
jgi:hypothetical protein